MSTKGSNCQSARWKLADCPVLAAGPPNANASSARVFLPWPTGRCYSGGLRIKKYLGQVKSWLGASLVSPPPNPRRQWGGGPPLLPSKIWALGIGKRCRRNAHIEKPLSKAYPKHISNSRAPKEAHSPLNKIEFFKKSNTNRLQISPGIAIIYSCPLRLRS